MLSRSRAISLALAPALVFAVLLPDAVVPRDAEACSKGGSPAARHRFGAVVESAAATPTDLIVIRSPVGSLRSSEVFASTVGHIETADGAHVPLQASQVGEMPDASLGEVRSALIPASALAPRTSYAAVLENLATRESGNQLASTLDEEALRLPFTTGDRPRAQAKPIVIQ